MKKDKIICPNCGNQMTPIPKLFYNRIDYECEECGTRIINNKTNYKGTGND